MKPSLFIEYPWDSTLQNMESEKIAKNIMNILSRTGNIFRELTWDEYKLERLKDAKFSEAEKYYFEKVITYCANEERAMLFSPIWRDAYIEELKRLTFKKYSREEVVDLINKALGDINSTIQIQTYPDGTISGYDNKQWLEDNVK